MFAWIVTCTRKSLALIREKLHNLDYHNLNYVSSMKFIGREKELEALERTRLAAQNTASRMTVVTGRRRVGKTTLIRESLRNSESLYFFVPVASEAQLCARFAAEARKTLNVYLPSGINEFRELFEALMEYSKTHHFTLVIDEFQNFLSINPTIYGWMQDTWDRLKDSTHLHLILSGSSYSMMRRIFEDSHEPLFGRATTKIEVRSFFPSELKEAFTNTCPSYENEDLLALYTITGGVPFYVADFLDNGAHTLSKMVQWLLSPGTIYKVEGRDLVRLEIGEGSYRHQAVLSAIAMGATKFAEIESKSGLENIAPYLERLEYSGFIQRNRPILSKPTTKVARWAIGDPFLRFWYRFMAQDEGLLEAGFVEPVEKRILEEYPTYSGAMLERWFREALMQTGKYRRVGSWWNSASEAGAKQWEVDIVAIGLSEKDAYVAEVKRQRKAFKEKVFLEKVEHLKTTILHGMNVSFGCLTMEDM